MTTLSGLRLLFLPATMLVLALGAPAAPASAAACVIPNSPCYPWSIRAGEEDTVLLEIVPNNADTGAIYRICVCPQTPDISVVFDFFEARRALGVLSSRPDGPICRDFRIQTSRQSTLKLRRTKESTEAIEGCYQTY